MIAETLKSLLCLRTDCAEKSDDRWRMVEVAHWKKDNGEAREYAGEPWTGGISSTSFDTTALSSCVMTAAMVSR